MLSSFIFFQIFLLIPVVPVYGASLFPQGFRYLQTNHLGFSNAAHSMVSDLLFTNPALISTIQTPKLGIAFDFNKTINNLLVDFDHSRVNPYLPVSVSVVKPFKYFVMGFGFY